MEDLNIKICSYLKGLFELSDRLASGISAINQWYDIECYHSIDDDFYLETKERLYSMQRDIEHEIIRIITNRINQAEKADLQ